MVPRNTLRQQKPAGLTCSVKHWGLLFEALLEVYYFLSMPVYVSCTCRRGTITTSIITTTASATTSATDQAGRS